MKKSIKIITTLMAIGTSSGILAPIASCSCSSTCKISCSADIGGSLSGTTDITVESGTNFKKIKSSLPKVIQDKNYRFAGWFVDNVYLQDEYVIESNINLVAKFTQLTDYTVIPSCDDGATIVTVQAKVGLPIKLNFTTNYGYDYDNVEVIVGAKPFIGEIRHIGNSISIDSSNIDANDIISVHLNIKVTMIEYSVAVDLNGTYEILSKTFGEDILINVTPISALENATIDIEKTIVIFDDQTICYDAFISPYDNRTLVIPHEKITSKIVAHIALTNEVSFHVDKVDRAKITEVNEDGHQVATFKFISHGLPLKKEDSVTINITSQVHNKTPEETSDKQIEVYGHNVILIEEDGCKEISFQFEAAQDYGDENLFEIKFNVNLTCYRTGQGAIASIDINNLYFENGIATKPDMFEYDDDNQAILKAPKKDDKRWEDANILLIPKNVKTIVYGAFADVSKSLIPNIRWVLLDETWGNLTDFSGCSLETIEQVAFQYCTHCRGELYIPSSVKTIGTSAFNECSKFDKSNLTFGKNSKIQIIKDGAFRNCHLGQGTQDLVLPTGLKEIEHQAFTNCDFNSVYIPNTVTKLNTPADTFPWDGCFQGNSNLKIIDVSEFITVPTSDQWTNSNAFRGVSTNGTVYIHDIGQLESWKKYLRVWVCPLFEILKLNNLGN